MPRGLSLESISKEEFLRSLDDLGAEEVRVRLDNGQFSFRNDQLRLAREWLRHVEARRSERRSNSGLEMSREILEMAKSAQNAAWVAAIAATISVVCTVIIAFVKA